MEPLFRLALMRPAVAPDERAPSIPLAQASNFQQQLAEASQGAKPRERLKTVARAFIATTGFVGSPDALAVHGELKALAAELDVLEGKDAVTNAQASQAIENAFGKKAGPLVTSKALDGPMASLKDSIIAIKQLPEEHGRPVEALTNQLRDLEVILKVADDKDFPGC